jgi:hypothetical protein
LLSHSTDLSFDGVLDALSDSLCSFPQGASTPADNVALTCVVCVTSIQSYSIKVLGTLLLPRSHQEEPRADFCVTLRAGLSGKCRKIIRKVVSGTERKSNARSWKDSIFDDLQETTPLSTVLGGKVPDEDFWLLGHVVYS